MHDLTVKTHLRNAYLAISKQPAILPLLGLLAVLVSTCPPDMLIHRAYAHLCARYVYAIEHDRRGFALLQTELAHRLGTELSEHITCWWVPAYNDGWVELTETSHWDIGAFEAPDAEAARETAAALLNLSIYQIEIKYV